MKSRDSRADDPAAGPAHQGRAGAWERLQANADANRETYRREGIVNERVGAVACRACGALEKAFFWTMRGRTDDVLLLECPVCEGFQVRYSLRENRVVTNSVRQAAFFAVGLLLTMVLGGGVALFVFASVKHGGDVVAAADAVVTRLTGKSIGAIAGAASRADIHPIPAWSDSAVVAIVAAETKAPEATRTTSAGTEQVPTLVTYAFVAAGNRSAAAEDLARELGSGDAVLSGVRVRYVPALDQTVLVLNASLVTPQVAERLQGSGWRRVDR